MKKLLISIILTAAAFSSFAMEAEVISTTGKAESQVGGNWVALKNGDILSQGSVIQTGFKSEIVLKIKESTVTVAPLSRLTLQQLAEKEGLAGARGKDETTIYLDTGSLKSKVQKSPDRRVGFTVRSPVATASVRGTDFQVVTKFRSVDIKTTSGKVAAWKNTATNEKAFEQMISEPLGEEATGNDAQDVSEYAPQGAFTVSQGEQASFSSSGQTSTRISLPTILLPSFPSTVPQSASRSLPAMLTAFLPSRSRTWQRPSSTSASPRAAPLL